MHGSAAITVFAAICLGSIADAQQHSTRPAAKPPAEAPQHPQRNPGERPQAQRNQGPPPQASRPKGGNPRNGPGSAENLERLLRLSPEQRNRLLSGLPPARRAVIEKRLNDYQAMPEKERVRALDKLRRMQSLPPQKQNQVRVSSKKFLELPQPRRGLVRRQIDQLKPLSDVDRRAVMNSEEFRNRFTPAEQQMIDDICLVTPQEKP